MHGTGGVDRTKEWDWFSGDWRVRHRRLKSRLKGDADWEEFGGTCRCWVTLGGLGNVDDNVIHLPSGSYRAMTVRAFDEQAQLWSIWWLDARQASGIEPAVHGRFEGDAGTFMGEDILEGVPIVVRFLWSRIRSGAPVWEQAFSNDGGKTWETNWVMKFERASGDLR
jgi:hypothetical protein